MARKRLTPADQLSRLVHLLKSNSRRRRSDEKETHMKQRSTIGLFKAPFLACLCLTAIARPAPAAPADKPDAAPPAAQRYAPFEGAKSAWHEGFERYDFVMDGKTMTITPFNRPADEKFGIGAPRSGERRCVVICPKESAPGNPWSWQGCYWDHQPQTEVELLR